MTNSDTASKIVFTDITDHLPIVYIKYGDHKSTGYTKITYRPLTDSNIAKFKDKIYELDTSLYSHTTNAQDGAEDRSVNYLKHIGEIYNDCFPIKTKKMHNKTLSKPWITQELLRLINKKNRLYGKKLRGKKPEMIQRYKECKKYLAAKLKASKIAYYREKLMNSSNNMKDKWDAIRLIINKKKKNSSYCPINNQTLGNHYSSMAEKLNSKLKTVPQEQIINQPTMEEESLSSSSNNNIFDFKHVSQEDVYETILKLDSSKGSGPDEIHVKVIKEAAGPISSHMSNIFNKCIDEGVYPSNFKFSKCIPIFKGGILDSGDPVNYRPISILNCLNKVFERLLHKQLYNYLEKHELIPNFQYGYRKKHSTCHAVLDFSRQIEDILDSNEVAISIFMDLSKAFDTVDRSILCKKLEKLGIRGVSNNLIESYMTGRYFYMKNDNNIAYHMNYGVPQGSILGPLLFLIYIYDMKYISNIAKSIVYADDTTIVIRGSTVNEAMSKANDIMERYYNYFTKNKLTINESKTKYMVFSNKSNKGVKNGCNISVNNYVLEQVTSIKFLGVIINNKLNWNDHKEYIQQKIRKSLGILYKCRQVMTMEECVNMYKSFVVPYFLYCLPVWGGSLNAENDPITKLQNKVLRVLTHTKRTGDAWNYVRNIVLPVKELYKLEVAKFCIKHFKGLLPNNFSDTIMPKFANQVHNIQTRHSRCHNYQFQSQQCTKSTNSSFTANCIRAWNSIPYLLKMQADMQELSYEKYIDKLKDYYLWTINNTT